jgi:uncharacterized membrane protein
MAFLLALTSALFYGSADFLGGMATRRAAAIPVVFISQAAGLLLVLVLLPAFPAASPTGADIAWGAAAGVAGGTGVALLYHALAIGTMSVVAPTTAVCGVAIPVVLSVLLGERPGVFAVIGIVLGIAAIVLVSMQPTSESGTSPRASGLQAAIYSGIAIGIFYFALAQSKRGAGFWPLATARAVSVSLLGVIAMSRRVSVRMPRALFLLTIGCGLLDMTANGLYMVAAQIGPLSPVVTLASLYPAATVLLASVVLHERLNTSQKFGVGLALVAVLLIVRSP